ncbi:MAG: 2-oxoacid:ferredoxin oxidoreductase subunit beta [Pseudomonadota bacterium]
MVDVATWTGTESAWCPGCGNFGILRAMKQAMPGLGLEPWQVLMVSGIGQAGKFPHYITANTFNTLHGRTLPAATAAKCANRQITVLAIGGDGDMYGEGGNHLLHAIRRNPDITCIVHNNQVYGLTKGQASPTTDPGMKTRLTPEGVINAPFNAMAFAVSQRCGFVARAFAGDVRQMVSLIQRAVGHRGFSLLEILQPCPTFNKLNTFRWYRERAYKLEEQGHDPLDPQAAMQRAWEWGERIPTGVFFTAGRMVFEDGQPALRGQAAPLNARTSDPRDVAKETAFFS